MLPFGSMDPKKMHGMLKKMGIKSKEVEADEVVIKQGNKKIIISNPQVSEVEFSGQVTFQIFGNVSVEEAEEGTDPIEIKDKDIEFVSKMAHVSPGEAKEALIQTEGDIAKAILTLKK